MRMITKIHKVGRERSVGTLHGDVLIPGAVSLTSTSRKGILVEDISVVNYEDGCVEVALGINC